VGHLSVGFVQIDVDRFSRPLVEDDKFISVYGYTWKLSCSLYDLSLSTCFAVALQL